MKSVSACWLIRLFEYLENNPHHLVNGFLAAGTCISQSIDAGHPVIPAVQTSEIVDNEDTSDDEENEDSNDASNDEENEDSNNEKVDEESDIHVDDIEESDVAE